MENTYEYVASSPDGETSPVIKSLPPLIKIDRSFPVGYSGLMEHNHNANSNCESSDDKSSEAVLMSSATPSSTVHTHHRPTIITIAPSNSPPQTLVHSSSATPTNGTMMSPNNRDNSSPQGILPRPLVEPIDTDRPERMRDWLVRMINSGRFPGLKWLDKEQAVFRVPWIHAKKRDYNQERDAALFREWALHSGKYGDGSDVTTWKINFRCALNGLKDIVERKDLEEQDCRVYQMLTPTGTSRRRKRRRPGYFSSDLSGLQSPDNETDLRMRLDLQSPVTTPTFSIIHPPNLSAMTPTMSAVTPSAGSPIQVLPIIPTGTPLRTPIMGSPPTPQGSNLGVLQTLRPMLPQSNIYTAHIIAPNSLNGSEQNKIEPVYLRTRERENSVNSQPPTPRTPVSPAMQFSPKVISPLHTFPSPAHHNSSTSFAIGPSISMHPALRSGPVYCPPAEFCTNSNAITVRVLYGSITVHMETFDCSRGARIYYGPLHCRDILSPEVEEKLFGPLNAHQISLSPRHPAGLAREIFSHSKRGLVLEVQDECVYATALCRTVVYHGCSPVKHSGTLVKEEKTRVFNYKHRFLPSLKYTTEGRGIPPKPYALFSLGQPWGGERPLSKNLVTVVVTYCKALNDLRVKNVPIHDDLLFEAQEARDIRIISPTPTDLEAEHFLNPTAPGEVSSSV